MKERPILFSAPMVRALLAGTKTQTRRVVKPKMPLEQHAAIRPNGTEFLVEYWPKQERTMGNFGRCERIVCPYGQPGDRLWVRESWARTTVLGRPLTVYREGDNTTDYGGPWKPGIHMFRRDSRITLEVTGVRVERLQDIAEADAKAEGAPSIKYNKAYSIPFRMMAGGAFPMESHIYGYQNVWVDVHGGNADSWHSNPWVWVVEFKRVTP